MFESIMPDNEAHWLELRSKDLTSTDIAALFGCSPYSTHFEVHHRFASGVAVEFKENARTIWGSRLESVIAEGIAEDNEWIVTPMAQYIHDPELRIGSSFDYKISEPEALLEIKNVDSLAYKDGWIIDEETKEIEAPPYIEFQVQHQMLVSGYDLAYIGALIGGNTVKLLKREADKEVHEAILKKCAQFWDDIAKGVEPDPDFERDAEFIALLYRGSVPGKTYDATDDMDLFNLATQYRSHQEIEKEATGKKKAIKAQILMYINDIAKVNGESYTISAGTTLPTVVEAYERKAFRNFRINWKKGK